ncbi:MAG: SDR family oxidoreductase [Dehalococcoidia bacterium]
MTTTVEKPTEAPSAEEKPKVTKTAIVTGASSGIGEEFARQLAGRGYAVVLVARRRDRLDAIAKEIAETGATAEVIEADLSKPEGVAAVVKRIGKGDVDMLVNNAGFGINGVFGAVPLERELEEIDLNVRALTELSHAAITQMKPKRAGTIINVGSTGSYQPVPYMSTYAATKAYVLFFSEGLHEEAKQYGVTVTCLCPGGTSTEFQQVAGVDRKKLPRGSFMEPAPVVKAALNGAKAGRGIVVPGMMNKTTANLNRFLPRSAVRKIAGRMFKHD